MLEILVARVEVVPKVIPLIIIHKPVVALARHTRALHGTRVRVFGMDGERQKERKLEGRKLGFVRRHSMSMTKKGVVHVNLVALVDWLLFNKLHKRQPLVSATYRSLLKLDQQALTCRGLGGGLGGRGNTSSSTY